MRFFVSVCPFLNIFQYGTVHSETHSAAKAMTWGDAAEETKRKVKKGL